MNKEFWQKCEYGEDTIVCSNYRFQEARAKELEAEVTRLEARLAEAEKLLLASKENIEAFLKGCRPPGPTRERVWFDELSVLLRTVAAFLATKEAGDGLDS